MEQEYPQLIKLRDTVIAALKNRGFSVDAINETINPKDPVAEFLVNDTKVQILPEAIAFNGPYIYRHYEVGSADRNSEVISEFVEELVFFLKNPELRDKPSILDLRRTLRWVLDKCGVHLPPPLKWYQDDLDKRKKL